MGNVIIDYLKFDGNLKTSHGEKIVRDASDEVIMAAMQDEACVGRLTALLNSTKNPELHKRLYELSERLNEQS